MNTGRKLRAELLSLQLQALREYVQVGGRHLAPLDRLHLARATALLVDASRIEEGRPTEIGVVRSATALEDALQLLVEEAEGAEET